MARITRDDVGFSAATAVVGGTDAALANAGAVRIMGYSVFGTTLHLYDGAVATDAATDATVYIRVIAGVATDGGSANVWLGPQGVRFTNGLVHQTDDAPSTDTTATVFYIVDS